MSFNSFDRQGHGLVTLTTNVNGCKVPDHHAYRLLIMAHEADGDINEELLYFGCMAP